MKKIQRSSLDMIMELPENIIENILAFLPLKDAARTSILSTTWRYQWAKLPQLVFDKTFSKPHEDPRDIAMRIYYIMLRHQGPVLKFTLVNPRLRDLDIDRIVLFLSKNGIQELNLYISEKLPSIFFCLRLKHLSLYSCDFIPPPTFKGFSELISLELQSVRLAPDVSISRCPLLERLTLVSIIPIDSFSIDAPKLKVLLFKASVKHISILNSPLLATLSLSKYDKDLPVDSTFDLIDVFGCLPRIENLHMHYSYLKLLAVHNVPKELPTLLNYLRILELSYMSFTDELSSVLSLIRSSPKLQKLKLIAKVTSSYGMNINVKPALEYLRMQEKSDVSLSKLREVDIQGFTGSKPQLEFIKFLLSKLPELETVYIKPSTNAIFINGGYKILMELARFRRASQKAEIIFVDDSV